MMIKYILTFFIVVINYNLQAQSNNKTQLVATTALNLGLHYHDNGQEGNLKPKFGGSLGLQIIRPVSRKIKISFELLLAKTSSEIHNYRVPSVYQGFGITTVIYETTGDLSISEIDFQIPVFIRHEFGKSNNYYLEYGIIYKDLISSKSKSNLKRIDYFPPFYSGSYLEEDKLELPNETTTDYTGFKYNNERFGLIIGFGRRLNFGEVFSFIAGLRISNNINNVFHRFQNPKSRHIEFNIQVPIIK